MTFQELGQSIRQKREAMGLSIDDVAARIKISGRILRSIEEGSQNGLPHTVYTKSFARSFGQLVGYDPAELSAALEAVFPQESLDDTKIECVLGKSASDSYPGTFRRVIALAVLFLLLGGLCGGIWYVATQYGDQIIDMVKQPFSAKSGAEDPDMAPPPVNSSNGTESSSVDNVFLSLLHEPDVPAPPSDAGEPQVPLAARTALDSPAFAGVAASEGHLEPNTAGAATQERAAGASIQDSQAPLAETAAAQPDAKNHLLLTCVEACWISSRADGARGRDYTLNPGERFALTYTDTLELTLGNAGGVSLVHNGKNLGSPGRRGQRIVLRFPDSAR